MRALRRYPIPGCPECYATPEIFNTDQGSPLTSIVFTGLLQAADVRCSMDGRGRCPDNVFIKRCSSSGCGGP